MVGFSLSHSIYWEVFSQWFLNLSHVDNQTRLCLSRRQYFCIKQNHESQVEGAKAFRGECYSENRLDLNIKTPGITKNMFEVLENPFSLTWSFCKNIKQKHPFDKCVSIRRSWAKLILTYVRRQRTWVMSFQMGFLVKGKGSELLGKKNTTYIHSWCDVRKLYKHMMDGWTWTGFCTICKDPEFVYEESHCLYNPILGMGFRPSILNRERSGLLGVVCTPNMSDEILTGLQHKNFRCLAKHLKGRNPI